MQTNTDSAKIKEAIGRGVENIYPSQEALEQALKSGRRLRIYSGIDPTGKLHMGHLTLLKKLRQFQDLGHDIIVLLGDFTATIGDPTDKLAARKPLTKQQVSANAKYYKKQIAKVLDLKRVNVKFLRNEKWTNKLKPVDLLEIFSHFTVSRLLERSMFKKRIQERKDILLHEFVYPVFQAYDSVAMDIDLEIGGNDQTFNMLRGRDLMKKMRNKEKLVMTLRLLTDPSGKKMGKTEGNMINLDETANEMYGKIMRWPDNLIIQGLELCTDVPTEEIQKISAGIKKGSLNPKTAKARLAEEIILIFYGKEIAKKTAEEFNRIFKEKKIPSGIAEIEIGQKSINILDLLAITKIVPSKSEAKRMILQGGVKIDGIVEGEWQKSVEIKKGMIIQVGKRRFVKII